MTVDDLAPAPTPGDTPVWDEVADVARSVDRQLECLRSILAAADGGLADGPLGELVRGTSGYVAGRLAGLEPAPAGAQRLGVATLRSLAAISALAARSSTSAGPACLAAPTVDADGDGDEHEILDLVASIVDEVIDRYRVLVADIGAEHPAPERTLGAMSAPLELFIEQLGGRRWRAPEDQQVLGPVVQLVGIWLLIAAHVAEARAWVQAERLLASVGGGADDSRTVAT